MGFRYPHDEAEFLVAISLSMIAFGIVVPIARQLPSWAGIPLAILPLAAFVIVCVVFWYRTRR